MFAQTYAKYYDLLYQIKPYKKECKFIYKWADKPKSILDIGCGTASYWKYFPEKVIMIGIEKSKEMIAHSLHKLQISEGNIKNMIFNYQQPFDCVTALFNVINYIPSHNWWSKLPLKKGGYYIFDLWDKKKVDKDDFDMTLKRKDNITRVVTPLQYINGQVVFDITIADGKREETETHVLYIHSEADIKRFCGKEFKIVDKKETKTWQMWFKLKRK